MDLASLTIVNFSLFLVSWILLAVSISNEQQEVIDDKERGTDEVRKILTRYQTFLTYLASSVFVVFLVVGTLLVVDTILMLIQKGYQ